MIPLLGQSKISADWPETGDTVLLQVVESGVAGGGLGLECFYGASESFAVGGVIGEVVAPGFEGPTVALPVSLGYLGVGDILGLSRKRGLTRVLFRGDSDHNSLLVTERCDHYCIMCSQPPRNVRDDELLDEILALIPRLPPGVREIGFTGGEPTLAGERMIEVLRACRDALPHTAIHVLSNGRRFADRRYAEQWTEVGHSDLMVGIPIYSDLSYVHDYVVQADGAFDETVRGILNLKSLGARVEVRVVLHRHTIAGLRRLASFLARNLGFVDHVALMGLELMGFAIAHQDDLWIKVEEHAGVISDAAEILAEAGVTVSIYNIPLCLLEWRSHRYAVASISDWKREYWPDCDKCALKADCGGAFFSTRARLAKEIRPVQRCA